MKKTLLLMRFCFFQIFLGGRRGAYKRADYFFKNKVFKSFGKGCYWHPVYVPSFPEKISIGNNVTVCADVKFYEHDIVHRMWNGDSEYRGPSVKQYEGEIYVGDNSVLGGNSIILYNVHIGKNVLVAAGSVVTKDVEDYAIVAGNPAHKVGDTRVLLDKRCPK